MLGPDRAIQKSLVSLTEGFCFTCKSGFKIEAFCRHIQISRLCGTLGRLQACMASVDWSQVCCCRQLRLTEPISPSPIFIFTLGTGVRAQCHLSSSTCYFSLFIVEKHFSLPHRGENKAGPFLDPLSASLPFITCLAPLRGSGC